MWCHITGIKVLSTVPFGIVCNVSLNSKASTSVIESREGSIDALRQNGVVMAVPKALKPSDEAEAFTLSVGDVRESSIGNYSS